MAYMEEKTCLQFIKWTSDMPSQTKMTFMANFGGVAKYGDCSTNWSRKDGRIVYSVFHNFIAPTTLDSGINVGVCLLIFGLFSSGYVLIKGGTFIIFLNFSFF